MHAYIVIKYYWYRVRENVIKKCDDFKGNLEHEKVNMKFLVYTYLDCEKCHEIKFEKKLIYKFENTS